MYRSVLVNRSNGMSDSQSSNVMSSDWDLYDITRWIIIPATCSLGLAGNLASFVVFLLRIQERIEIMEKGSILGMIALSVTDFIFCLLTLISTFYQVC